MYQGVWDPPWLKKTADLVRGVIKPKTIPDLPPSLPPVLYQEPVGGGIGPWLPWMAVGLVALLVLPRLLNGRK
jgi:hypothetical protein